MRCPCDVAGKKLTLIDRNELRRAVSAEGVLWTVREAWPAAEGYWNLTVGALPIL